MKDKKNEKRLTIRNSTAEFLVFTSQAGENTIEVRVEDDNVWLTQKLMAKLFDVEVKTINYHLKEISQELETEATIRKFRIVQKEGNREVSRDVDHYSLEAIISTGFRVNSERATNFRRWANQVLKDFTLRGYVLDDIRLKNGAYLSKQYFRDLILEIRDIRESERNFYQQITDIYATAIDYDLHSPTTKTFFATVQNKLHFATHGNTAAEPRKAVTNLSCIFVFFVAIKGAGAQNKQQACRVEFHSRDGDRYRKNLCLYQDDVQLNKHYG